MAETSDRVMTLVEEELEKDPDISTRELFEKAKEVDAEIGELTPRQFNARYPLQVKRRRSAKAPGGRARRRRRRTKTADAGAEETRGAIREVLLDFARDIAAAEDKASIVDVIGGVDRYVERVEKAAKK